MKIQIFIKRLIINFFKAYGFFAIFFGLISVFTDFLNDLGLPLYISLLCLSIVSAYLMTKRKTSLNRVFTSRNSSISIFVGDLFEQNTHIVIGTNDLFDTELGRVISPKSVQGQYTKNFYNSDVGLLDKDINEQIKAKRVKGEDCPNKNLGKKKRYPLGTTVSLGVMQKQYLVAYSTMSVELKCESNSDILWHSMTELWKEIRLTGQGQAVSIPIIGSELARTGLSRLALIQMIMLSFVAASNSEPVSSQLNIVVHKSDVEKIDFVALEHFLEAIEV